MGFRRIPICYYDTLGYNDDLILCEKQEMLKWFLHSVAYLLIGLIIMVDITGTESKYGYLLLALLVIWGDIMTYFWIKEDLYD